jgi:hypothetical protein
MGLRCTEISDAMSFNRCAAGAPWIGANRGLID